MILNLRAYNGLKERILILGNTDSQLKGGFRGRGRGRGGQSGNYSIPGPSDQGARMNGGSAAFVDVRRMRIEARRREEAQDPDFASVEEVRVVRSNGRSTEAQEDPLEVQVRNSTVTTGLGLLLRQVSEKKKKREEEARAKEAGPENGGARRDGDEDKGEPKEKGGDAQDSNKKKKV